MNNFNSKKLAAFASIVASIMATDAPDELKLASLLGALAVYVIPQAILDRGKAIAEAALKGVDDAKAK